MNTVPCAPEGYACGLDEDCCDGMDCQDGACVRVAALICRGHGEICATDRDCCPESGTACIDGKCACPTRHVLDRERMVCESHCAFPGEQCDAATPCCDGAGSCIDGRCTCAPGERSCGALCISIIDKFQRDVRNCGERSHTCAEDEICCEGKCWGPADLAQNPDHCGRCCSACHHDQICCNGRCQDASDGPDASQICCADGDLCRAPDGTEQCCALGETCVEGACCPTILVCGDVCCGEGSFCQCGICVTDLATCDSDADCCDGVCTNGFCCPATAICHDFENNPICCGGTSICRTDVNICEAIAYPPGPQATPAA
jgi:hypothetical protein